MAFHVPLETPWTLVTHWYFYQPRTSLKNTCLSVYMTFKPIPVCTRTFWANNRVHQKMCIKPKTFWVFLIESWINWLLAFHMPWERSTWPSISYLEYYIVILLDTMKEDKLESKETIFHCFLTCLCLSLHPFVPLEHTMLLFPSLPLLCKISIVMEDWSGGGPSGGLGFSGSKKFR